MFKFRLRKKTCGTEKAGHEHHCRAVPSGITPLTQLSKGDRAVVMDFFHGHHFQNRLSSMGLHIGSEVEVLKRGLGHHSPVLLKCSETRLAIGHSMADKIMVKINGQ